MSNCVVEEVAASLVREYLSRKVRRKMQECPLKALLEIITRHLMEHSGVSNSSGDDFWSTQVSDPPCQTFKRLISSEGPSLGLHDLSEEERGESTAVSDTSKTETHRPASDFGTPLYTSVPSRAAGEKSKSANSVPVISGSSSEGDREAPQSDPFSAYSTEGLRGTTSSSSSSFSVTEPRGTMGESHRLRSGRLVRGMMAGPIASSQEDSLKKRSTRRPLGPSFMLPVRDEPKQQKNLFTLPLGGAKEESMGLILSPSQKAASDSATKVGRDFVAQVFSGPPLLGVSSHRTKPGRDSTNGLFSRKLSESSKIPSHQDKTNVVDLNANLSSTSQSLETDSLSMGRERRERRVNMKEELSHFRKPPTSIQTAEGLLIKDLKIDDVDDEEELGGISRVPVFSSLAKLQIDSAAINLSQAVEMKVILFGSSLGCFSEEWKIQSFTFNNTSPLRYGIVQKKGGPCGVLASVQACFLQKLLFEDSGCNNIAGNGTRQLQPSKSCRTRSLALAIADILWRAGEQRKAVVTLFSGKQQFIPAGRYKADGVLEMLVLHTLNSLEELTIFLEQNAQQVMK
nr:PREDICTED: protein FAM188B-like isoform X1 [Latimeria chalumnae]|eukprot:XP_006012883.2 PREDICTED: protein FAM188B-like isoform X1 [Latimeria chalumnae]